jgi:hypothetical protein
MVVQHDFDLPIDARYRVSTGNGKRREVSRLYREMVKDARYRVSTGNGKRREVSRLYNE